jgi:hypothetical protein
MQLEALTCATRCHKQPDVASIMLGKPADSCSGFHGKVQVAGVTEEH